jgi:hypothetical protein
MGEYYKYPMKHLKKPALLTNITVGFPGVIKAFSLLQTISYHRFFSSYGRFYLGWIDKNKFIIEVILLT